MVSWSGPRTGPCSTCLLVLIRTPEALQERLSVSLLAVFRVGRVPGSLNRMFSLWGWFCFVEGLSTDPPCILLVLLLLVL